MLDKFRESTELQDKGTDFELLGMIFKVRRMNDKWSEALQDAKRDIKGPFVTDSQLTPEEQRNAIAMAMSSYLIAGWSNVKYEEGGDEVPFNFGNCEAIFKNIEYMSLVNEIFSYALNKENYLYKKLNEDIDLAKK